MITEDKVIELARQSGILDEVQVGRENYYCFSDEEVYKFANALHDEFIKSLGAPKAYTNENNTGVITSIHMDYLNEHYPKSPNDKTVKLYALPNDK